MKQKSRQKKRLAEILNKYRTKPLQEGGGGVGYLPIKTAAEAGEQDDPVTQADVTKDTNMSDEEIEDAAVEESARREDRKKVTEKQELDRWAELARVPLREQTEQEGINQAIEAVYNDVKYTDPEDFVRFMDGVATHESGWSPGVPGVITGGGTNRAGGLWQIMNKNWDVWHRRAEKSYGLPEGSFSSYGSFNTPQNHIGHAPPIVQYLITRHRMLEQLEFVRKVKPDESPTGDVWGDMAVMWYAGKGNYKRARRAKKAENIGKTPRTKDARQLDRFRDQGKYSAAEAAAMGSPEMEGHSKPGRYVTKSRNFMASADVGSAVRFVDALQEEDPFGDPFKFTSPSKAERVDEPGSWELYQIAATMFDTALETPLQQEFAATLIEDPETDRGEAYLRWARSGGPESERVARAIAQQEYPGMGAGAPAVSPEFAERSATEVASQKDARIAAAEAGEDVEDFLATLDDEGEALTTGDDDDLVYYGDTGDDDDGSTDDDVLRVLAPGREDISVVTAPRRSRMHAPEVPDYPSTEEERMAAWYPDLPASDPRRQAAASARWVDPAWIERGLDDPGAKWVPDEDYDYDFDDPQYKEPLRVRAPGAPDPEEVEDIAWDNLAKRAEEEKAARKARAAEETTPDLSSREYAVGRHRAERAAQGKLPAPPPPGVKKKYPQPPAGLTGRGSVRRLRERKELYELIQEQEEVSDEEIDRMFSAPAGVPPSIEPGSDTHRALRDAADYDENAAVAAEYLDSLMDEADMSFAMMEPRTYTYAPGASERLRDQAAEREAAAEARLRENKDLHRWSKLAGLLKG